MASPVTLITVCHNRPQLYSTVCRLLDHAMKAAGPHIRQSAAGQSAPSIQRTCEIPVGHDFECMVPMLTSKYDAVLKSICSTPGHLPVTPQTHDALHGTEEQGLHECVCCFGAVADSAHIAQPHGAQQALWQLVPCIALSTRETHRIQSLAACTTACTRMLNKGGCVHIKPQAGVFLLWAYFAAL